MCTLSYIIEWLNHTMMSNDKVTQDRKANWHLKTAKLYHINVLLKKIKLSVLFYQGGLSHHTAHSGATGWLETPLKKLSRTALHGMSHLGCHTVHLINKQEENNILMRIMWCFSHESCASCTFKCLSADSTVGFPTKLFVCLFFHCKITWTKIMTSIH